VIGVDSNAFMNIEAGGDPTGADVTQGRGGLF
jgi:hypothetical protein